MTAPPSPTQIENARPGSPDWLLVRPARQREIEGYASATSVERGQAISLYVNTASLRFGLEVFRVGWYAGAGARRVFGPLRLPGRVQPTPAMHAESGLVDCDWTDPFLLVTADAQGPWPSGVYLVRLTASPSSAQSFIVFVVRDDTRHADVLLQLPVTTWQAYNTWGGKSLYHWGSSGKQRASQVSFNRPYAANANNAAAGWGMGAGEFLTNLQPHPHDYGASNAGWDVNLVRWLEREGRDVAYCTNLDTHAAPERLLRCRAWLSSGHDEYWSAPMRRHVEAARDAGVHLAFFGANAAYWQVRLEASAAANSAERIMVCRKKTDKWRGDAVGQPEQDLIGVMYDADPVDGDIVVAAPSHWLFDGTGLQAGDRLTGLLGYEVDRVHGAARPGLDIVCASPWTAIGDTAKSGVAHMSLYRAASGAWVFAGGSMQWAWGLDNFNAPALRWPRLNPAAMRITRNLLARMLDS